MNILVTNNMVEYKGFIKVKTLKEACEVVGNVDCLIYHKSNESKESKVDYLTRMRDKVSKSFVYIRNKESVDNAVQITVMGMGGRYFDDEFFLESSEELQRLISSLDEVTAIAELGGVSVLSDFFNRYLKNGSSGFNEGYLTVVKEAVSGMISEYKAKDLELLQLSETATEIFASSANIISKVESESARLKGMVSNLEKARDKMRFANPVVSNVPSVLFFPTVSYVKERSILRVKEIGICTYLMSFMLGYRVFLERLKYVRPKLIVLCQVGSQFEVMYKDFNWITQQTQNIAKNYEGNVVFTNFPTREVLFKLLDDTEYDTFVVLDRTKSSKNHLLNCKGGSVRYCVSAERLMKENSIKESSCFSLKKIKGTLFSIPVFENYPKEYDQRERLYLKECLKSYEALYSLRRS